MKRLALLLMLAGCGSDGTDPAFASSSTSIAFDDDGLLWVTSPDDDRVVVVDPETLDVVRTYDVEGAPEHLAVGENGVWVTTAQNVAVIRGDVVERIAVGDAGCAGTRAIVALPSGNHLASCPNDDRLIELDDRGVVATYEAPGRPTALAVAGDTIYVSASKLGEVRFASHPPTEWQVVRAEERDGFAASQLDVLAAGARGGVVAAYQRVDHDSDRSRDPARGGYGSVVDDDPRIDPRVLAPCGSRYARFDGGSRVFSGPSAAAYDQERGWLWVVNQYTDDVALIACDGGRGLATPSDRRADVQAAYRVGRGPRGIVVRDDRAWIDVGFDHAIARLAVGLGGVGTFEPELARTRELGPTRLSERALRGRNLFHDADDTHLTPSGVVTCATCHPGGGEDGLVWFLHTENVGPKSRRTPPAWGARPAFVPFHWDGEFTDARELTATTLRELMEGDGLLVDLDAIVAYMAEVEPPTPRTPTVLGQASYEDRCAECHRFGTMSGTAYSVVEPSDDELANLTLVDPPPLRGVRARAPYLHDGRAATLRDVLTIHNRGDIHARTSDLSEAQLDALISYVEAL